MSLSNRRAACLLIAWAVAQAGCHAPWSVPDEEVIQTESPPRTSTVRTSDTTLETGRAAMRAMESAVKPPASPPATDANLAGVLEKLEQVGEMDPAAQRMLMEQLQQTEPRFWPAAAEQFRSSLQYRQELSAKTQRREDSARFSEAETSRLSSALDSGAETASPDRIPVPPSTPLGMLNDPRGADVDGVSSEAFAHSSPAAQGPPLGANQAIAPASDTREPAVLNAVAESLPIKAARPASQVAESGSAAIRQAAFTATSPATEAAPLEGNGARDWQSLVEQAADELSDRVAESPATTAEIHQHVSLRILRLLAGQTEGALEPIPHLSAAEQEYWSQQIFALATYLDHHGQPDDKRRAAASAVHLDEAVSHLRELSALALRNFAFCKNVYGYGAIEPYESDRFSPGQQVTLYVEVENYHSQSTEKGFTTSLGSSYEILDEKGERVDGGKFPDVEDTCRGRRRDFHIQFGLALPERMTPGRYRLELVVRDGQSDKLAHSTADFEIRGSLAANAP